jgi:hypothetical protein
MDISYFSHEDRKGQTLSFEGHIEHLFEYIYGKNNRERNSAKKIQNYENLDFKDGILTEFSEIIRLYNENYKSKID